MVCLGRISATLILAFGFAGLGSVSVHAQADICDHLESRLISLDSHPGSGGEAEKYRQADRAVRRQRDELEQASDNARRAGCIGGFFGQLKTSGSCARVSANINRMKANLDRLTRARDRFSTDPFDDGRERADLVAALAQNRCGPQYEAAYDLPGRRPGLFATLFGGHRFRERGWGDNPYGDDFGTFRTLCVRTCDGYYFPISFSTTQSRFASDEAMCKAQCPGTAVELYTHHSPGEESEAMVSLAGEPYSALPTAFRYRREYDKACTCGKVATLPPVQASMPAESTARRPDPWNFVRGNDGPTPLDAPPPFPPVRPGRDDPETLANRSGSLVPETAKTPAAVAELKPPGERSVRVVGPNYFYAQ